MRYFFSYILLSRILGNPLIAFLILLILFFFMERKFVGIIPDVFKPFRRKKKIANLKTAIKLNPADTNAHRQLGTLYLEDKKYKEAEENLTKVLEKMDNYAESHFLLGKSYYLQGKADLGVKELKAAVDLNPKIAFGEPYVYLLKEAYSNGESQNNINEYLGNLHYYGTVETLYKAAREISKYDSKVAKELFNKALDIYKEGPKYLKKTYRRWAVLAKIKS